MCAWLCLVSMCAGVIGTNQTLSYLRETDILLSCGYLHDPVTVYPHEIVAYSIPSMSVRVVTTSGGGFFNNIATPRDGGKYFSTHELKDDEWKHPKASIYAPDGTLYDKVANAHDHVWSPDGSELAFTRGYIDGNERFTVTGLWIYTVASKREKCVVKGDVSGIVWASFDGNIYYHYRKDCRVLRYNTKKETDEETDYQGTSFSAGGTYYCAYSLDSRDVSLYSREDNTDITHQYAELAKGAQSCIWLSDSLLVLLESCNQGTLRFFTDCTVIDLKTKKSCNVAGLPLRVLQDQKNMYVLMGDLHVKTVLLP